MPYKSYPDAPVKGLVAEYKKLLEEKKKAILPKTKTEAQKKLDAKGLAIKNQLKTDMDGIRKNFNDHTVKVENYLTNSNYALRTARGDLANYLQRPNQAHLENMVENLHICGKSHDDACADAGAYGQSWALYRALSGYQDVDDEWIKDFAKMRSTLMADQKPINLKVEQMKQNVTLVEAVIKEARGTQRKTIVECQNEAKFMDTRLNELLNEFRSGKVARSTFESKLRSLQEAANGKELQGEVHLYEGIYTDLKNIMKIWESKLAAMKTTYISVAKGLAGVEHDPTVKAALENGTKAIKEAGNLCGMAVQGVQHAAKNINLIHEKAKLVTANN